MHKLHSMEPQEGYSSTFIYALEKCSNAFVTHTASRRFTWWSMVTEAPTLELRLFQNKPKTTANEQTPCKLPNIFFSRRACHHVKSKRATDSTQRLPPPPPPQATSRPWAVPNLLPSACRATAAAGSAPQSCSATVGPRCTEPGHPLSRVSPYSRFKKRRAKMTVYSHLAPPPSTDVASMQIRFGKHNLY